MEKKEVWNKYENKGLSGLTNMGNTCYVNSCFQIFSHTYELSDLIMEENFLKRLSGHTNRDYVVDCFLMIEYYKLHKLIWENNNVVQPGSFIRTIHNVAKNKKNNIFNNFNQNDISEFILFVLDCFHNSLRREVIMNIKGKDSSIEGKMAVETYKVIKNMYSKEYSEVLKIFGGMQINNIMNKNKKILISKPEPFFIISLSIPEIKEPTLFDCLDLYCNEECLEGENAWFNEETQKKEDIIKQTVFWNFSNILIIDLKRFNMMGQKIQKPVDIPINDVDFSKYIKGYDKETFVYDLYGICNHMGGTLGGHYTSYVKNANNKWYHFNDTHVNEINIEKHLNKNFAYCLFYRKKVAV